MVVGIGGTHVQVGLQPPCRCFPLVLSFRGGKQRKVGWNPTWKLKPPRSIPIMTPKHPKKVTPWPFPKRSTGWAPPLALFKKVPENEIPWKFLYLIILREKYATQHVPLYTPHSKETWQHSEMPPVYDHPNFPISKPPSLHRTKCFSIHAM